MPSAGLPPVADPVAGVGSIPNCFIRPSEWAYATDVNEVQKVGRIDVLATDRTDEQTRFAQLFANAGPYANVTNPFRLWSNVARDLAQQKSMSLAGTARLFAMVHASIHDGVQTSQHSKAVYRLWRPETAIAHADVGDRHSFH